MMYMLCVDTLNISSNFLDQLQVAVHVVNTATATTTTTSALVSKTTTTTTTPEISRTMMNRTVITYN